MQTQTNKGWSPAQMPQFLMKASMEQLMDDPEEE
jgi:hypothetical protein